jgi:hypothetical protein
MTARGKTGSTHRIPVRWPTAGSDSARPAAIDGTLSASYDRPDKRHRTHLTVIPTIVWPSSSSPVPAAPVTASGANLLSP